MATWVDEDLFWRGNSLQPPIFPVVQLYHRAGFLETTTASLTPFSSPKPTSWMWLLQPVVAIVQLVVPGKYAIRLKGEALVESCMHHLATYCCTYRTAMPTRLQTAGCLSCYRNEQWEKLLRCSTLHSGLGLLRQLTFSPTEAQKLHVMKEK